MLQTSLGKSLAQTKLRVYSDIRNESEIREEPDTWDTIREKTKGEVSMGKENMWPSINSPYKPRTWRFFPLVR